MKTCHIDMDGVLVDFVKGYNKYHDIDVIPTTYNPKLEVHHLGFDFWIGLDPTEECFKIMDLARKKFDDVQILTAPSKHPQCRKAKKYWINMHFGNMKVNFLKRKHFRAHPKCILIDDSDHQVDKFNQKGGIGILFPRPWNRLRTVRNSFRHLQEVIENV